MKGSVAFSALSIVSILGFAALPVLSGENENPAVSEYCAAHDDLGLSHGACVAYLTTHNIVPHDATVCQSTGIQSILGVSNHGQCVKKLGELRK
jgi:hypothetical protein